MEPEDEIFFMDDEDPLSMAIFELEELKEDSLLQKNIKLKVGECLEILKNDSEDLSIRLNKVSVILDEISEDPNVESFSRTRLYNVAQLLERV